MSFSSEVKEEISKLNIFKDKNLIKYELLGYLITNNITIEKNRINYATENEYNINRLNKLLKTLNIDYTIKIQGKLYVISLNKKYLERFLDVIVLNNANIEIKENFTIEDEKYKKAVVRGAFLGSGSINDPNKTYHLEIIFSSEKNAKSIINILESYEIYVKELTRKNGYSIYLKEGEEVSKFLAVIEAFSAVIKFEEIRVIKETRNSINRLVNCETANLNKTVGAAVKQIEAIKLLKKKRKFNDLDDQLKEIAELRIQNPDASLVELGKMLKEPIGKSGVNYRLNRIMKIAEELK